MKYFIVKQTKTNLKPFSIIRKQREEFRKRLVGLIIPPDEERDMSLESLMTEEEKQIQRYYYYVRYGVDTIHVSPLDQVTLERVRNY